MAVVGLLIEPLFGCSGNNTARVLDAGAADAGVDRGGLGGAGGSGGTSGQTDAGIPASGGSGGLGGTAGSAAGGSGGVVGTGGACASFRECDPGDQMVGYTRQVPLECPVEHECYYLQGSCGPTTCLLRAGVHCGDPLVCDPGDFPATADTPCRAADLGYEKYLCGKSLSCCHSVDGGATVDATLDDAPTVEVAVDTAQSLDSAVDNTPGLGDGPGCDPDAEYNRQYMAASPAICATIRYACPDNTTFFQSDCGCGCEQRSSCPQYVACTPGAASIDPLCDPSSADCPYTLRAE